MASPSLLDIAKRNGSDAFAGLIDEVTKTHPELDVLPARTIRGLNYKTLVRVGLGQTTGSFRDANAGTAAIKNTYENRQVETFILSPRIECDKAVADKSEDGPEAYLALETEGVLEGEMQGLSAQFYYGSANHAKGYPGLINTYDATNMVVDAGGTTASTGSSVWLVKMGPKDVIWVWGANGSMAFSPTRIESIIDPADSTKKFDGYVRTMHAYPGVQQGSTRSVCRIKKLTADAGKGLTDALINQALAKFPVGLGPDVIFMTQRSAQQLQGSRTATNPTGTPAPWPVSVAGVDGKIIPIRVTEAISNTESLTL